MTRSFYALVIVLWLLFAVAVISSEVRRAKASEHVDFPGHSQTQMLYVSDTKGVSTSPLTEADPLYGLRDCESGNDYAKDTGNGFYGAYQFSLTTWYAVGGEGYPHMAPPEEQDARAWALLTRFGSAHWPVCQFRLDASLRWRTQ